MKKNGGLRNETGVQDEEHEHHLRGHIRTTPMNLALYQ